MAGFIWKPSTVNSWKGGPVLLTPSGNRTAPTITANGKSYTGKFINDNEGHAQFVFPKELIGMQNLQVNHGGQTGTIASGATSYEGDSIGSWDARAKGSLGGGGIFAPGQQGQFGFYPSYLGGQFPSPVFANYQNIKTAPYKFTDPFDFAKKFGELNREEIGKNYELSKNMGLDSLQTELKGLQGFAPAAAALQRSLTSADNQFNQSQRTAQVNQALPGVSGQLDEQSGRAERYASGRLPSSIENRAFEVASRSKAADLASAGGFGAASSAARKTSELLSAEDRVNLSKYGDQLLTQNIGTKANLFLAPTEYANAGSQIRVNPTVDAATRATQAFGEVNQQTLLSPGTAFQGNIQQNQFKTGLEQQTRQFNASNQLQTSMFNAGAANQFAMQQFGYNVGYAGTVAGAAQTNANTQTELQQQQEARNTFEDSKSDTQFGNAIGGIAGLIAGVGSFFGMGSDGSKDASGGNVTIPTGETPAVLAPDASDFNFSPSSTGQVEPVSTSFSESPQMTAPITSSDSPSATLDFARAARIAPSEAVNIKSFINDVGTGGAPKVSVSDAKDMVATSSNALKAAGVSKVPRPGYVPTGYSASGAPTYSDKNLLSDPTLTQGAQMLSAVKTTLKPFQSFHPSDSAHLDRLIDLVSPELVRTLDVLAAAKDSSAFSKFLTKALKNVTARDKREFKKMAA